MTDTSYIGLTRQSGLQNELRVIANNIANAATSGYKSEGVIFSEFIHDTHSTPSVSMAMGHVRNTSFSHGSMTQTGAPLDVAVDGRGFFMVQTQDGPRLTRAGAFHLGPEGTLITADGQPVLDVSQGPISIPLGGVDLAIATDGAISVQGNLVAQIGVFDVGSPNDLIRRGGVLFDTLQPAEPIEQPLLRQGFLEDSNVNPLTQIARMIEVQRAYELGQDFANTENERMRNMISTLIK